jgi:phosphoglycolate phosphatase-like HAD superfamily hydrolase
VTPLFDGIQALIEKITSLKKTGVKLGALSNAGGRYVKAVLRANHVFSNFDATYGADEVPTPKPSPNGLLYMCKNLGVRPDKCIYIGDSPSDGKAGKAAGMVSIGVSWGSNSREKLEPSFDYVTDTVSQLDHLIDSLMSE